MHIGKHAHRGTNEHAHARAVTTVACSRKSRAHTRKQTHGHVARILEYVALTHLRPASAIFRAMRLGEQETCCAHPFCSARARPPSHARRTAQHLVAGGLGVSAQACHWTHARACSPMRAQT
eukprot:1157641-Pleurochrysis_carterae.AAC.1